MRSVLALLLIALVGCASIRAHGTWAPDRDVGTIVTAGLIVLDAALERDRLPDPLCEQPDPPHTCPGTTPGPVTPPPPPPDR